MLKTQEAGVERGSNLILPPNTGQMLSRVHCVHLSCLNQPIRKRSGLLLKNFFNKKRLFKVLNCSKTLF